MTNKKANQSNMKNAKNTTIDETYDKCGETEDTIHLFTGVSEPNFD